MFGQRNRRVGEEGKHEAYFSCKMTVKRSHLGVFKSLWQSKEEAVWVQPVIHLCTYSGYDVHIGACTGDSRELCEGKTCLLRAENKTTNPKGD